MSTTPGTNAGPARPAAPAAAEARGRPGGKPAPQAPSREARQRAAAILEVLAGARTPLQAAEALGVSLSRYYLLEERALAGLLAACERQPPGRSADEAQRLATLERECQRWQRECARLQALVRAAQRSIGLAAPPPAPLKDKGKRRKRRPVVRALQAAARLRPSEEAESAPPSTAAPGTS